jgi:hypothetical protein
MVVVLLSICGLRSNLILTILIIVYYYTYSHGFTSGTKNDDV